MKTRCLSIFLLFVIGFIPCVTNADEPSLGELGKLPAIDPIRSELVMNLVVTCSSPVKLGPSANSKDGTRENAWPIIGGRFEGPGIRGTVIPGGADYPLMRRDGMMFIDAKYSLLTDDGVTIIIHNYGIGTNEKGVRKYRLTPEFWAPEGKYDWLNKSTFICTLTFPAPKNVALAKNPNENDRLLQFYRIY